MPPEVKMERASANRNLTVIRATPAQTALLRAAYAHSNVASQQQLAELSEQTGLPQKWIHQWFGRQRSKDRKGRPDSGVAPNLSGGPSTHARGTRSGSVYSQGSITQLKSESAAPGASLSTPSGSEYLGTVSASSSMVIEEHPDPPAATSSVGQASKGKRKGPTPQTDQASASNTRTLRSRTKKVPDAQDTLVKKEMVEESLSKIVSTAQSPTDQSAGSSRKVTGVGPPKVKIGRSAPRQTAPVHGLNHAFLPMISPAKRSPITSLNVLNVHQDTHVVKPSSKLSIHHSDNIYVHPSGVQAQAPAQAQSHSHNGQGQGQASDYYAQLWNSIAQNTAAPYHYDKPVFHTRFRNNGPSNFVNNNFHDPTTSTPETPMHRDQNSYDETFTEMARPAPFPLAPAFDWSNPIPSGSNSRESEDVISSSSPNSPDDTLKPLQFRFEKAQPSGLAVALDEVITELDPSVAPQKYLVDVLAKHRDEKGNYTVNEGLIGTLLENVPPFRMAMGLSFLSKLGLEV